MAVTSAPRSPVGLSVPLAFLAVFLLVLDTSHVAFYIPFSPPSRVPTPTWPFSRDTGTSIALRAKSESSTSKPLPRKRLKDGLPEFVKQKEEKALRRGPKVYTRALIAEEAAAAERRAEKAEPLVKFGIPDSGREPRRLPRSRSLRRTSRAQLMAQTFNEFFDYQPKATVWDTTEFRRLTVDHRMSLPTTFAQLPKMEAQAARLFEEIAKWAPSWTPKQLSDCVSTLASLSIWDPVLEAYFRRRGNTTLTDVTQRLTTPKKLAGLTAGQACRLLWSLGKLGFRDPTTTHRVGKLLQKLDLTPENAVTALTALALLQDRNPELLQYLGDLLLSFADKGVLQARTIANAAWAFAILGIKNTAVMDALALQSLRPDILGTFQRRELANLAWAYARLQLQAPDLMTTLARHLAVSSQVLTLDGQSASMLAWALAASRVTDDALMNLIADRANDPKFLAGLTEQGVANLAWAFATLDLPNPPLFAALTSRAAQPPVMATFTAQGIANLAWALARMGVRDEALMGMMAERALRSAVLRRFKPAELATTIWAFAKLDVRADTMMEAFGNRTLRKGFLADFDAQNIANLCWAHGRLGVRNVILMDRLAIRIMKQTFWYTFDAQEVANTAWGYARLGLRNTDLMACLAKRTLEEGFLDTFKPQELSHLAWAFATLRITDDPLMAAVAQRVANETFADAMAPQAVANVAWAFATLGVYNQGALVSLANRALMNLVKFKPQELMALVWAHARFEFLNPRLLIAAAERAAEADFVRSLKPIEASNLVWAFARLGIPCLPFLEALADRVSTDRKFAEAFGPQELAMTLWASARLRWRSELLLGAFAALLTPGPFVDAFDAQEVTITAWALARLGYRDTTAEETLAAAIEALAPLPAKAQHVADAAAFLLRRETMSSDFPFLAPNPPDPTPEVPKEPST
jgi:hypothetical protein